MTLSKLGSVICLVIMMSSPKVFAFNLSREGVRRQYLQNEFDQQHAQKKYDDQNHGNLLHVTCPDSDKCHPSVGMLISFKNDQVDFCTATLWNKDILLTSIKCASKIERNTCKKDTFVIFPAMAELPEEVALVEKVLYSSSENEFERQSLIQGEYWIDYAFIKLSREVTRRPIIVDPSSGLPSQTLLTVYKFETKKVDNIVVASMLSSECKVKAFGDFSWDVRQSASEFSPTSILEGRDCKFSYGSSGAPLVDEAGSLRGLVTSSYLGKGVKSESLSKATNVACIFPETKQCQSGKNLGKDFEAKLYVESGLALETVLASISSWANSQMKRFGWTNFVVKSLQSKTYEDDYFDIFSVPTCAVNARALNEEHIIARNPWYKLFSPVYAAHAKIKTVSRVWRYQLDHNEAGEYFEEPNLKSTSAEVTIDYSPESMMNGPDYASEAVVTFLPNADLKNEKVFHLDRFRLCTETSSKWSFYYTFDE